MHVCSCSTMKDGMKKITSYYQQWRRKRNIIQQLNSLITALPVTMRIEHTLYFLLSRYCCRASIVLILRKGARDVLETRATLCRIFMNALTTYVHHLSSNKTGVQLIVAMLLTMSRLKPVSIIFSHISTLSSDRSHSV